MDLPEITDEEFFYLQLRRQLKQARRQGKPLREIRIYLDNEIFLDPPIAIPPELYAEDAPTPSPDK